MVGAAVAVTADAVTYVCPNNSHPATHNIWRTRSLYTYGDAYTSVCMGMGMGIVMLRMATVMIIMVMITVTVMMTRSVNRLNW